MSSNEPTRLSGITFPGLGEAHKTLAMQWDALTKEAPELRSFHRGTVNVWLEKALFVWNADHTIRDLAWAPRITETFRLLRVTLTFSGRDALPCWVYAPSKSFNRLAPNRAEIIASVHH